MYKNVSIKQKLYALATLIGTIYVIFHLILLIFANDVKSKWDSYNNHINEKSRLIDEIEFDLGFNGIAQIYNNYLLTNDPKYLELFNEKYTHFLEYKKAYLNIGYTTQLESNNLNTIEETYNKYKYNLEQIVEPNKKKSLQIDDTNVINAVRNFENYFKKQREETTTKIHTTIQYIYFLSIFVVLSIFLFALYIKGFLNNTIIQPLLKIEEGLSSFFKFLSNKQHTVTPIDLQTGDEFGVMAQSINQNIILTSHLHNDLTHTNRELNKLLESYGHNVIASKTDIKGIITYCSEAFEKISGYSNEELIGKPHNIVRHKDMPASAFKEMWDVIQSGKIWEGEVKNRKKNGDYYYVKATISPIFDDNKNITGYSAIREDITNHKEVIELNSQLDIYKNHLESKVQDATRQIEELMTEIEDTQKEVVFTMGAIGERRSEETGNHVKRVAEYSKLFALYCGMDEREAEMLRQASPMHDIGKVGIADSILNKAGLYTPEEHKIMQDHAVLGYNMLKSSKRELLKTAAIVAHEHHERWDGKGYPRGLKGEEIHIYGRITAITDVFDALGSFRVYKEPWKDEVIFNLFKEERGKQFDPQLVDIFFEHIDEFLKIRDEFCDSKLKELSEYTH